MVLDLSQPLNIVLSWTSIFEIEGPQTALILNIVANIWSQTRTILRVYRIIFHLSIKAHDFTWILHMYLSGMYLIANQIFRRIVNRLGNKFLATEILAGNEAWGFLPIPQVFSEECNGKVDIEINIWRVERRKNSFKTTRPWY